MSNWFYTFRSLPYAIVGVVFLVLVLVVIGGQFIPKVNRFAKKWYGRIIVPILVCGLTVVMTLNLNKFSSFMKKINAKEELSKKELDILLKEEVLKNEQLKTEVENNKKRYCLWLVNVEPYIINQMPLVKERVIDPEKQDCYVTTAEAKAEDVDLLVNGLKEIGFRNIIVQNYGPIISASCGPATIGVYYKGQAETRIGE